ncbi:MAG: recombinase family protein, partial [bacterium]
MTDNRKPEKPCAIYVRVSTQKQAEEGISIESQIETLKQEAARRGKPVYDIYNDAGVSGGAIHRPEFQRMLKDSQQKPPPFDLILTWSISRFGRNTMESYIATEKLRERGISIFYYKEPFSDEDPVGNMVIQILRAVAEFSRLEYVKDVERSKTHLAQNGFSTGGPPPFGLRRVEVTENGKCHIRWEPDPETAPIARKIFEMYANGCGFKKICRWLNDQGIPTIRGNKWQAASFSRMLRNEIYIGNIVYNKEVKRSKTHNGGAFKHKPEDNWIRCDGAVEPIVPKEVFDRVQLKLRSNNISESLAKNSQYLLSGLLKCNVCGNAYFGQTAGKEVKGKVYSYSKYICSKQNRYNEKRDNVSLKREWFDDLIMNRLFERILSEVNIMERIKNEADEIKQAIDARKREMEEVKKEKKRVDGVLKKYYEAFESGTLSPEELKSRIKTHQGQADEIDLEIRNLQNEIAFCESRQDGGLATLLKVDFKRLRGMFDAMPFERRKEFLRAFIDKIIVDPKWYEIHYVLPSGLEVDHLLFETTNDDNGGGSGEKSALYLHKNAIEKIRKYDNGGSAQNPQKNSVDGFNGDGKNELRCSTYRKSGKNPANSNLALKNTDHKKRLDNKPISA